MSTAALQDDVEMVELLLVRGALVSDADRSGDTALHVAVRAHSYEVVAVLLARSASVTALNKAGESAFHIAAAANDGDMVRQLIRGGADIDQRNAVQETALHIATRKAAVFAAGALIAGGADVHFANAMGDTPLHLSVYVGQAELSEALISKGASEHVLNEYGLDPKQMARVPAIEARVAELVALISDSGEWVDRGAALGKFQALKSQPAPFVTNALALQVIGVAQRRARTLVAAVKLGIGDSQEKLGALLMVYGDKSMAEDYLNSGSTVLHSWAVRWGNAHGYRISTGQGSHRATWGQF